MIRYALAALLFVACGAPPSLGTPDPAGTPIGVFHEAEVFVEPGVSTDGLDAEIDAAVAAGLAYWSAPAGLLDGWRIFLAPHDQVCQDIQATVTGCCEWKEHRITASTVAGCRTAVVAHEIGHALLGDPGHLDPRWPAVEAVTGCP